MTLWIFGGIVMIELLVITVLVFVNVDQRNSIRELKSVCRYLNDTVDFKDKTIDHHVGTIHAQVKELKKDNYHVK